MVLTSTYIIALKLTFYVTETKAVPRANVTIVSCSVPTHSLALLLSSLAYLLTFLKCIIICTFNTKRNNKANHFLNIQHLLINSRGDKNPKASCMFTQEHQYNVVIYRASKHLAYADNAKLCL